MSRVRKIFGGSLVVACLSLAIVGSDIARAQNGGDLEWAQCIASSGESYSCGVDRYSDGSVVMVGYIQGTATFGEGSSQVTLVASGQKIFLAKYDSSGVLLWARKVAGGGHIHSYDVTACPDGSAVIAGSFYGTVAFGEGAGAVSFSAAGSNDLFVAKYDSAGALLWAKRAGQSGWARALHVTSLSDGSAVLAGQFEGTVVFREGMQEIQINSSGSSDAFVAKYSAQGAIVWAKKAGGAGWDAGIGVAGTPDGSVLLAGGFQGSATFGEGLQAVTLTARASSVDGYHGVFVAKYNSDGALVWVRKIDCIVGRAASADFTVELADVPDGGALVMGTYSNNALFNDGAVEITSSGSTDVFLARYGEDGTFLWAGKVVGSAGLDVGFDMDAFSDGSSVLFGAFTGSATFGEGLQQVTLEAEGVLDQFVTQFSADGQVCWAGRIGPEIPDNDYLNQYLQYYADGGITTLGDDHVMVTGAFQGTVTFGEAPYQVSLSASTPDDIFVAMYKCGPATPRFSLTVTSLPYNGVPIASTTGHDGVTSYQRSVEEGANVVLTAPDPDPNGYLFARWVLGDTPQTPGVKTLEFTMTAAVTATAEYNSTEYYVNNESYFESGSLCTAPGNDANNGITPATPKRRIQAILDAYPDIGAGVTVYVDPGIYPENVLMNSSHSGLAIRGAGIGKSLIDGGEAGPCLFLDGFESGTIEGFALRNGDNDAPGGGIRAINSSAELRNLQIAYCRAESCGGGVAFMGGSVSLVNSIIAWNEAGAGGAGIYLEGSGTQTSIVNCVVAENTVAAGGAGGHGLLAASGGAAIFNTIVWGNSGDGEGEVWIGGTGAAAFARCDVEGGVSGIHVEAGGTLDWVGGNNLQSDPMFAAGSYRLQPGSPCIDVGDGSVAPERDIEGIARYDIACIPNSGCGTPEYVDIGAYELVWSGHALTVTNGSGGGYYATHAVVTIIADAPPSGQIFRRWTGDTATVANVNAVVTSVTMPDADVAVTATYGEPIALHTLTVVRGTGGGDYAAGEVVLISADPDPVGMRFDCWTGDTAFVADVTHPSTSVTMPAEDVTVTAAYTSTSAAIEIIHPMDPNMCLERGSKTRIAWRAPGLGASTPLRFELINGSGEAWVLAERANSASGFLNWTVGKWKSKTGQEVYPDGDTYRIRISTLDGSASVTSEVFAIGVVTSLEILGPDVVDENSSTQYTCMAHFNYGAPADYTATKVKWSTSSRVARMKFGLLTVGDVAVDTPCEIGAEYGRKENYCSAVKVTTIRNN